MKLPFKISIFIILFPLLSFASGPSFDCKKAGTQIEKVICKYPELGALDVKLASKFKVFRNEYSGNDTALIKTVQRQWLRSRNARCSSGEDYEIQYCLTRMYEDWLFWIDQGILAAPQYVKADPPKAHLSAQGIKFIYTESKSESDDGYSEIVRSGLSVENAEGKLTGIASGYSDEYQSAKIGPVHYLLTSQGDLHTAIEKQNNTHAGRCDHTEMRSLLWLTPESNSKVFGETLYYIADHACGTSESKTSKVLVSPNELKLIRPKVGGFYFQVYFPEVIATVVDFDLQEVRESTHQTTSDTDYFGKPYSQLFDEIETATYQWRSKPKVTEQECGIPDYAFSYYRELKVQLGYVSDPITYEQVKFIAYQVLTSDHLKNAKIFQPVIVGALDYLTNIKKVDNWQVKLVEAANQYANIEATSNFYYSNDNSNEWVTNPFLESGFMSNPCFKGKDSVWGMADMEEWIYLFWARRVNRGELAETEKLLQHIDNLFSDTTQ